MPAGPVEPVLRNRSYRQLFAAAAVSNFGNMLHAIALPFVAIAALDATPADIASLGVAGLLPGFLLGLFASVWVDRLRRRPLLVAADWASAAVVLWIPLAATLDILDLVQLHVVVAIHGLLGFVFHTAHHAILPDIVDDAQLVEANGKLEAASAVTEGVAFASGGWLIQWFTAQMVMIVDAASYGVSAVLLSGVRSREDARAPNQRAGSGSVWREIRDGARFLLEHPVLRPGAVAVALSAMSWRITGVVYLIYVYEELGFTPGVLGLVFALGAVSSLLGGASVAWATRRFGVGPTMIAGLVGFSLATWLLPLAPGAAAGLIGLAFLAAHQLGDGFEVVFEVTHSSIRQTATPGALLGRVVGAGNFAATGAMLLGLGIGGVVGETLGLRATLWLAGAVGLLGALFVALSPLRTIRSVATLRADAPDAATPTAP